MSVFYPDRSKELRKAARWLGWNHAKAQQGLPRTNPTAEGQILRVTRGVRKVLAAAGLPQCFWPYAARYWCFAANIDSSTGDSAWNRRHQKGQVEAEHPDIKIIPFGARVRYKPQPSYSKYYRSKFDPEGRVGIFMGYELQPGGTWSGDYLVADISDFVGYGGPESDNVIAKVTLQNTRKLFLMPCVEDG